MKTLKFCLLVLICHVLNTANAQDTVMVPKDSIVKSSWVVGIGYNIVDDSATPFGWDFFRIKETWNAVPYPSRLSVGKFWKNGIGVTAIGTYNKYKIGKLVDGAINAAERDYYAVDIMGSYDLNKIFGQTGWFDPYIHSGLGYSSIGGEGRTTANAGLGFHIWFNDRLGLDINTMGKWGLKENATRQLQHSAGVVYQFGIEKGLSKKGREKLALLEDLKKKEAMYQDSIAAVRKAEEEAKMLAERLEKEKEAARVAAIQKERVEKEKKAQLTIENEIKALGHVYFNLNSSYLTSNSKSKLDKLVQILEKSPTLKLKVTSHTDARGTKKYNMWLSEKRVKRTVAYLISKGIDAFRLESQGFGEEHLTNECSDGVYCSEEKHRENRRSEFIIINF